MPEEETLPHPSVGVIRRETPLSIWFKTHDPDLFYLHTSLGEHSSINGELHYGKDDRAEIYIHMINVEKEERDKGIGTELLQSFTAQAKAHGATSLFAHATSESALHLFAKVFGGDNLKIYRYNQLTHERTPAGLNFSEVMEKAVEEDKVDWGIGVDLNL